MLVSATHTIRKTRTLTIFQRIANEDPTAVKDCIDTYGNFIWALARKFTASAEEAEAAAREIYIDIWRYGKSGDKAESTENLLIAQIARRRLIKRLHNGSMKS